MTRGREAETPGAIPAPGWKDIALRVKDEVSADRVGLIAAGVAFYGLLALFPAITALIAIAGLLVDPATIVAELDALSGVLPAEVIGIVSEQAASVAGSQEAGLGFAALLGIGIALYSASKGMGALIEGINVAYDETETRGFVRRLVVTLGLTLALVVGLLASFGAMIGVPAVLSAMALGPLVEIALTGLLWLGLVLLTMLGLALLYRFAPSRDAPEWQWVSVGAVASCLFWIVASAGFAFYVANFASYNESFGSLAAVVVLLMWFWISAYVILMGAELNSEMEAQTRVDTTVGADRPMGRRDAEKADELGEAAGT